MRDIYFKSKNNYTGQWDVFKNQYPAAYVKDTVCEYSGYNDVDGRKIYEGDIVKIGDSTSEYIIVFYNGAFRAVMKDWYNSGDFSESSLSCLDLNAWGLEVVGNIYDEKY